MRKLIRTDGTEQELVGPVSMQDVEKMIGADGLDTVQLRHLGQPLHVMLVDDLALSARKPVNLKATELYQANCLPGTTFQIQGDVVIVPDEDY